MADTFKFQKDWYEAIINDKYVKTSPQEMAYILYAAMQYAFNDGSPIDLGEIFGIEFGGLNRSMANIYSQMDKIKNYEKNKGESTYDDEAIYKLRMEGKTGKEICKILNIPLDKEKSLSSNKGWVKAREEMKAKKKNTEICTDNTDSVKENTIQNTESVQNNIESVQNGGTESVQTVQKSGKVERFEF